MQWSAASSLCFQPVKREYYYGPNFGYIIAFKPHYDSEWRKVTLADPEARQYIHKDPALPANTEFQVKVKAFNNKGEGPYSLTAIIYSPQDGKGQRAVRVMGQTYSQYCSFPQRRCTQLLMECNNSV